jgi:hypothetical protein
MMKPCEVLVNAIAAKIRKDGCSDKNKKSSEFDNNATKKATCNIKFSWLG